MRKILLAGHMVRFINSIFIAGIAEAYFFFTLSQTPQQIAFFIISVSVLAFAGLTIIRDLFTEQHLGVKRLITVLATLSIVCVPALYLATAYHVEDTVVFILAIFSPFCVAAALLYGRRLILWIREGFNTSK